MSVTVDVSNLKARINPLGRLHALLCKRFKWDLSEVTNLEGYLKGRYGVQRETSLLLCHPGEVASALSENNHEVKVSPKEVVKAQAVVEQYLNQLIKKLKRKEHVTMKVKKKVTAAKAGADATTKKDATNTVKDKGPTAAASLPGSYPKPEAGEKVGTYTQRLLQSDKNFSDDQVLLILRKEFKDCGYTKKEISWNKWKLKQKKPAAKPAAKPAGKPAAKPAAKKTSKAAKTA